MDRRRTQSRSSINSSTLIMCAILIALFLFLTFSLLIVSCTRMLSPQSSTGVNTPPVANATPMTTAPSEPISIEGPKVVATASIGVTGDVMAHGPVIKSALQDDGTHDFSDSFRYIAPYFESYDFMIANLEVTLGGTEAGEYRGYPTFNCPDSMIDALQGAGVDMVLTSNNHTYDTGHSGFLRTQEILRSKGMTYTGTRLSESEATYVVQNINGIKVGMINYTYESGDTANGNKTLNGITVSLDDTNLINSFNYRQMDQFYKEVESAIAAMKNEGADFVLFFIHWGNEYEQAPSNTQKKIAQNLCDLGIDVIIGGHPHVVQPMSVLTSESGKQTYCIYSTGNSVSNQRRHEIKDSPSGHTEDGVIFSLKFLEYEDGTTKIADINVTPLWVSLDDNDGKSVYTIMPVDVSYQAIPAISQFADVVNGVIDPDRGATNVSAFDPTDDAQITSSYNRTMNALLSTLNECRHALGLEPVRNIPGK